MTLRFSMLVLFIILNLVGGCSVSRNTSKWKPVGPWRISDDPEKRAHSVLEDSKVTLLPSRISFSIPKPWLGGRINIEDKILTTANQIVRVAEGLGEWDTEYASVCNAIFPIDRCAFHGGDSEWGPGSGYDNIQMRVYVLDESSDVIGRQIIEKCGAEATRISGSQSKLEHKKMDKWDRVVVSLPLFFKDYGATARMDFYLRDSMGHAVVFCFMHTDESSYGKIMAEILNSVAFPN